MRSIKIAGTSQIQLPQTPEGTQLDTIVVYSYQTDI